MWQTRLSGHLVRHAKERTFTASFLNKDPKLGSEAGTNEKVQIQAPDAFVATLIYGLNSTLP